LSESPTTPKMRLTPAAANNSAIKSAVVFMFEPSSL
jgi:hypothetical protein